ncbi:MAG TPA: CotH kinase family protein [Candidatus Limnocylindria bacterium]|jgi:spore coat protein CotH|nr:CotH kinase family protein [Candidatus Limnocylindria bacterium]
MNLPRLWICLSLWFVLGPVTQAAVVINEIFYNAPDDWEQLQWIELHNTAKEPVDIGGWSLSKGVKLKFPAGTKISGQGYLVVSRNAALFRQHYPGVASTLVFESSLKHKGEKLELSNNRDEVVDSVTFGHQAPWPLSPDGESSSLERICPEAPADDPYNWAPSPPASDYQKPSGTPGASNTAFSAKLPPVIESAKLPGEVVEPNAAIPVEVVVRNPDKVGLVNLVYYVGAPNHETAETKVEMTSTGKGIYSGQIPGQAAGKIVRVRIVATAKDGAMRTYPSPNDLRPALSCWVREALPESKLTQFVVIQTHPANLRQMDQNEPSPEDQQRWILKSQIRSRMDYGALWTSLAASNELAPGQLDRLRKAFKEFFAQRSDLARQLDQSDEVIPLESLNASMDRSIDQFAKSVEPLLNDAQKPRLASWRQAVTFNTQIRQEQWVYRFSLNVEDNFAKVCLFGDVDEASLPELRVAYAPLFAKQSVVRASFQDRMNTPAADVQFRAQQQMDQARADLRRVNNALSAARKEAIRTPDESMLFRVHPRRTLPVGARERSTLVVIEPGGKKAVLYDFVRVAPRKAGWKIHFPKESTYRGMNALNVIFEDHERFVLAEPLAFDLYRRAGNNASLTDFVRLTLDGQPMGYHLLCEQPNKGFLRRNGLHDDGNLYKADWHGDDVVSRNEKKTHVHEGHDDLIDIVHRLDKSKGDAQWKIIRENIDVHQVATYFAINTVLAHWDGYFNNHFMYHDVTGSGKWTMYPWDQDKTYGFYDNLAPGGVFATMPLTFGMAGDLPPNWNRSTPPRGFQDVLGIRGSEWWRNPGYFSGPLLANPQFRAAYLARVKELLDTEFSEAKMMAAIDAFDVKLRPEMAYWAGLRGESAAQVERRFNGNLDSLRRFVKARREYLLAQPELQKAQPVDWAHL